MATIIDRTFMPSDRYAYDWTLKSADGWAQIDTTQDASYYGTWTNPFTREFVNYCEGDITKAKSDTDEEYVFHLREHIKWNQDNDYFVGIDPMMSPSLTTRLQELGLADCFHKSDPCYEEPQ